jgi:hypothetical protein
VKDVRELLDAYAEAIPPITALEPRESAAPKAFAAVRVVLDLHVKRDGGYCTGCSDTNVRLPVPVVRLIPWPCPTVLAVAKALDVEP